MTGRFEPLPGAGVPGIPLPGCAVDLGWLDCFCPKDCKWAWADAAAARRLEADGVLAMAAVLELASVASGTMLDVALTDAALGGCATGSWRSVPVGVGPRAAPGALVGVLLSCTAGGNVLPLFCCCLYYFTIELN